VSVAWRGAAHGCDCDPIPPPSPPPASGATQRSAQERRSVRPAAARGRYPPERDGARRVGGGEGEGPTAGKAGRGTPGAANCCPGALPILGQSPGIVPRLPNNTRDPSAAAPRRPRRDAMLHAAPAGLGARDAFATRLKPPPWLLSAYIAPY